uniref:Uncharacterized protein n=1 Tax=Arundo donax TaxID=35708 RepID=A0A0A9H0D6_ARUDO
MAPAPRLSFGEAGAHPYTLAPNNQIMKQKGSRATDELRSRRMEQGRVAHLYKTAYGITERTCFCSSCVVAPHPGQCHPTGCCPMSGRSQSWCCEVIPH